MPRPEVSRPPAIRLSRSWMHSRLFSGAHPQFRALMISSPASFPYLPQQDLRQPLSQLAPLYPLAGQPLSFFPHKPEHFPQHLTSESCHFQLPRLSTCGSVTSTSHLSVASLLVLLPCSHQPSEGLLFNRLNFLGPQIHQCPDLPCRLPNPWAWSYKLMIVH